MSSEAAEAAVPTGSLRQAALLLRLTLALVLAGHGLERLLGGPPEVSWRTVLAACCLVTGTLLLAGVLTYASAVAAALCLLDLHLGVLTSPLKTYMWSTLLFLGAVSALLWLAPWDDYTLPRLWRSTRRRTLAQQGPERLDLRLDLPVLLLRLGLGLDFLAAGRSKLHTAWVTETVGQFRGTLLPAPAVQAFATVLPYAQVVSGAAVALGLFTRPAACGLGVLLLLLTFGQLVLGEPLLSLWSMFVYLLAVVAVLGLPARNRFSLDYLLARPWRAR
jgi:thiosulfate dehydrogenase (quinone) large subunit